MKSGIQISSLRPMLGSGEQVREVFRSVRKLGCRWVQLQWIDPAVTPWEIAGALAENGLRSLSVQDFYETVRQNLAYYTSLNQATGGAWLCVSRIPERLKSREGLDAFAVELRSMETTLEGLGQKLCFHPVSGDFTAVPGIDAVAYLLEKMPELALCLDLYHLNRNCTHMPAFIRKYGSRIRMVHFKDSRAGRLVPAGSGDTDWTGVVRACLDAGVDWAFVEQETWEDDPYACLGQALAWLDDQIGSCAYD